MPDDPSTAPNFTKAGFGAAGDVNNVYDASQHSHQEDNSQHSHVHYHTTPSTSPPVNNGSSRSTHHWNIKIVIGVGGLALLAWLFKQQPQPPVVVPPIQNVFNITAGNHTTTSSNPVEKSPVVVPSTSTKAPPAKEPPITVPPALAEVLQVKLNRPSYKVDELMEITVSSQQAGYLYVLAVWGDGRVDTLFPNSLRPDAKIAAGSSVHLPKDFPPTADGQVLRYPIAMPALPGNPTRATESIMAVLSPVPLDLPHSTELTSMPGFAAVGMLNDPGFNTRGPQPKFMKMQKAPTLEFGSLPHAAVHYDVYR